MLLRSADSPWFTVVEPASDVDIDHVAEWTSGTAWGCAAVRYFLRYTDHGPRLEVGGIKYLCQ